MPETQYLARSSDRQRYEEDNEGRAMDAGGTIFLETPDRPIAAIIDEDRVRIKKGVGKVSE